MNTMELIDSMIAWYFLQSGETQLAVSLLVRMLHETRPDLRPIECMTLACTLIVESQVAEEEAGSIKH